MKEIAASGLENELVSFMSSSITVSLQNRS